MHVRTIKYTEELFHGHKRGSGIHNFVFLSHFQVCLHQLSRSRETHQVHPGGVQEFNRMNQAAVGHRCPVCNENYPTRYQLRLHQKKDKHKLKRGPAQPLETKKPNFLMFFVHSGWRIVMIHRVYFFILNKAFITE